MKAPWIRPLQPGDGRKPGRKRRAVRRLQQRLDNREGVLLDKNLEPVRNSKGEMKGWIITFPSGIDGVYGKETERAVKSFNILMGLDPRVKAGRRTLKKLGIFWKVKRILAVRRMRKVGIIPREDWGFDGWNGTPSSMSFPAVAQCHHCTVTSDLSEDATREQEHAHLRMIHGYHKGLGWSGLGYSGVAFNSGRIYEGRGDLAGAHTENRNSTFYGVAFVTSCGPDTKVSDKALKAAASFAAHKIKAGRLRKDATSEGHRDFSIKGKSCPGDYVYGLRDKLRKMWRRMAGIA